MGTLYKFACLRCKTVGGEFTRQAGGIGNAELVGSFKFYATHAVECGAENVRVVDEDDEERCYGWPDQTDDVGWLRYRSDVFPGTDEWQVAIDHPDDLRAQMEKRLLDRARDG